MNSKEIKNIIQEEIDKKHAVVTKFTKEEMLLLCSVLLEQIERRIKMR